MLDQHLHPFTICIVGELYHSNVEALHLFVGYLNLNFLIEVINKIVHRHLGLQIGNHEVDSDGVGAAVRNYYVCVLHGGFNELIIGRFDKPVVLRQHVFYCPAALSDVSLDSATQADVVVRHHKDLQVHQVSEPFLVESEDTLEDEEGLTLQHLCLVLAPIFQNLSILLTYLL